MNDLAFSLLKQDIQTIKDELAEVKGLVQDLKTLLSKKTTTKGEAK